MSNPKAFRTHGLARPIDPLVYRVAGITLISTELRYLTFRSFIPSLAGNFMPCTAQGQATSGASPVRVSNLSTLQERVDPSGATISSSSTQTGFSRERPSGRPEPLQMTRCVIVEVTGCPAADFAGS